MRNGHYKVKLAVLATIVVLLTTTWLSICLKDFSKLIFSSSNTVILYTVNSLSHIDDNLGYAGVAAYKKQLEKQGNDVILVDCGNFARGSVYGTETKGNDIVELMKLSGYTCANLGTREFDYGVDNISSFKEQIPNLLSCNFGTVDNSEATYDEYIAPYYKTNIGGKSVAFIGITNPEGTSILFEDGEIVYDFKKDLSRLSQCVQNTVDKVISQEAEYVVVLTDIESSSSSQNSQSVNVENLIQNISGVDAVLCQSESSQIENKTVFDKMGSEVIVSAPGQKFESLGKLTINSNKQIETKLVSTDEFSEKDSTVQEEVNSLKNVIMKSYGNYIGYTDTDIKCDSVELLETPLSNLISDSIRDYYNSDIAIINMESIGNDIAKGEIYDYTCLHVCVYQDTLCEMCISGSQLLDLLELLSTSNRDVWFLSGLRYTVDRSIPSPVVLDENNLFVAVKGERRIKNVEIMNSRGEYEPINSLLDYSISGPQFLLMRASVKNTITIDNKVVSPDVPKVSNVLSQYICSLNNDFSAYKANQGRVIIQN